MQAEAHLDEAALAETAPPARNPTPVIDVARLPADEHILSEEEAAAFLRVTAFTMKDMRRRKVGPRHAKINKNVFLYTRRDLVSWVDAQLFPDDNTPLAAR
jgi:hypothetical protein